MRRHPVQNHTDSRRVHPVDKIHKILRFAEARGRRVVTADLIPPRPIIGMLGYRHQLDVCIPHIGGIYAQLVRKLAVREIRPVRLTLPRAEMHFIDVDGHRRHRVVFQMEAAEMALLHICAVLPVITVERIADRGGLFARLGVKCVRIGFVTALTAALDNEFVFGILPEPVVRQRRSPDSARLLFHQHIGTPAVEVARQINGVGVRRPDAEHIAASPRAVCAQISVGAVVRSLMEKVFGKLILRFLHVRASRTFFIYQYTTKHRQNQVK